MLSLRYSILYVYRHISVPVLITDIHSVKSGGAPETPGKHCSKTPITAYIYLHFLMIFISVGYRIRDIAETIQ